MAQQITENGFTEIAPHISEIRRFWRVFFSRKLVLLGSIVIALLVIAAIFAPLLAPFDPYEQNLGKELLRPSLEHPLGTDPLGRDLLSRVIYGSRNSLMVGIVALGIASTIGIAGGLAAGYFGGWTYNIIMRCVDALMTFPMMLLALVVAALLGGGLKNVMLALGVSLIPGYARLMCAQVLSVKENDYILAEKSIGCSDWRNILRHVFPNCMPPLIVLITMQMGTAILTEASLSFLGVGIEPPSAAWGSMINDGRLYLITNPIICFAPGVAIMAVVFSFNMVGDGLRDALDPRLRETL